MTAENCNLSSWGGGFRNELGHKKFEVKGVKESLLPSRVNVNIKNFSKIACSEGVTLAITTKGELYVWGDGYKLGLNTQDNIERPTRHKDLSDKKVTDISCGEDHVGCVTEDGRAWFWGKSNNGCALGPATGRGTTKVMTPQEATLENVVQISCGYRTSAALLKNGDIYTWGNGGHGRLGHGNDDDVQAPKKVSNIPPCKFVDMGSHHCAGITNEGGLYTWGWGAWGNLGLGDKKSRSSPTKVPGLANIVHVSCSRCMPNPIKGPGSEGLHTLACDANGAAYAWGTGHKGQLGNCKKKWGFHVQGKADEVLPYRIGDPPRDIQDEKPTDYLQDVKIVQVAASAIHSMVRSEDGRLFGFGCGSNGRLGQRGFLREGKQSRNRYKYYVSKPTSVEYFEENPATHMCTARRFMIAVHAPEN